MVKKAPTAPRRGDVVWISFDPVRGHEQRGHRPALVVSSEEYNERIGLALVCPITSRPKGYVFEVPLELRGTPGVVLSDHVRSVDWKERIDGKVAKAPPAITRLVQENIKKIVFE